MRALAEERGWPRVPNDELASLCPGIGQSITEALGSRVVLAADGAVYKVPTSQEDGGDSYINDAPVDIRGSLPSHGCENEQYVKGIFDGDDRTTVVPELVTYAPFPFAQKVWNVSFKPY